MEQPAKAVADGANDGEPCAQSRCHRTPHPEEATGGDAMSDEQLLVADRGSAGPTDKLLRRAVKPLPDEED